MFNVLNNRDDRNILHRIPKSPGKQDVFHSKDTLLVFSWMLRNGDRADHPKGQAMNRNLELLVHIHPQGREQVED